MNEYSVKCEQNMNRPGADSQFKVIFLINGKGIPGGPGNCLYDKNSLYVTDSAQILNTLLDNGCAAAGYIHDGNRGEDLGCWLWVVSHLSTQQSSSPAGSEALSSSH